LYFVSPGQINFVVPDAAVGTGRLEIEGDAGMWAGSLEITNVAPGWFAASGDGKGAAAATLLRIAPDGSQSSSDSFRCDGPGNCATAAMDLGDQASEFYLILDGTGFRNASIRDVTIGGVEAEIVEWGAHPEKPGVDRARVRIPRELSARGVVDLAGLADSM